MNQENKLKHVAMVMDGNRRWATERGMLKILGHTEGAKNLKRVAEFALNQGVPYLTLYALSTENLKRSEKELKHLFSLFEKLTDYIADFAKDNVRFKVIGNLDLLPQSTQRKLQGIIDSTSNNSAMTLTLAIAYGGRDEIVRAVRKIVQKNIDPEKITEEYFSSELDTGQFPDVDLVVRTGTRKRLSNFLPWQTTYAEIYFTDTLWPALDEKELEKIFGWFYDQKRTKGK